MDLERVGSFRNVDIQAASVGGNIDGRRLREYRSHRDAFRRHGERNRIVAVIPLRATRRSHRNIIRHYTDAAQHIPRLRGNRQDDIVPFLCIGLVARYRSTVSIFNGNLVALHHIDGQLETGSIVLPVCAKIKSKSIPR